VSVSNLLRRSGEIPEGRAELVLRLSAYARERTLEPVLEPGVTLAPAQLYATHPEAWLSPLMFDGNDPEHVFFRSVYERIWEAMEMDPSCASGSRRTEAGEFGDEIDGGFDVENELPTQARRLGFVEVDGSEELLGCRS